MCICNAHITENSVVTASEQVPTTMNMMVHPAIIHFYGPWYPRLQPYLLCLLLSWLVKILHDRLMINIETLGLDGHPSSTVPYPLRTMKKFCVLCSY